ncbi:MAG: ATP synthase F1 subunit delta [Dehalococcoidia bacterium]|nr:ATP synthase F1 subunit delta [Dehalococcoidia bacterium]
MPGEVVAARRYAQAVFALAREQKSFDRWIEGLAGLRLLMGAPGAAALFGSSKATEQAKVDLVQRALPGLAPLAMNLARILIAKKRTALADEICGQFQQLYDEERGIVHASVRTAVALSDGERQALVTRLSDLTGKSVVVETAVDPAIIGGMVVRIGDRLIDGSTRTRLSSLRMRLQEAAG